MEICKNPLLVSDRYEKMDFVRSVTDQITLVYQKFVDNAIVDSRDLVLARFLEVTDDFATLLDISVISKQFPEFKGIVRGHQKVNN
jgi:hypothetical protein